MSHNDSRWERRFASGSGAELTREVLDPVIRLTPVPRDTIAESATRVPTERSDR